MLILRLIQKLIAALNSDGTPGQVAFGMAVGSALGLTPFLNLHNFILLVFAFLVNISFPAVMLGWIVFAPVGFLLDPVFDRIGAWLLLDNTGLLSFWTSLYNTPVIPLSNYNNTIVLGSLVGWVVLAIPIYYLSRFGVGWYRANVLPKLERSKFVKAVKASKVYSFYRLFRVD
ncbi:MAG: TIGR03546 family protein [Gemmatimonadota bacterium]|nr:TIGR03546 family protein [Gemmatimonadota bacterium]